MPKTNKMDKVLNFPRPEDVSADTTPGMLDRANRTFICTVLFLDIVEYAKKPVSQQLRVKEQFNARLSEALQDIAVNDRIILDTGDGAAINFLGDPEDALFVGISLAEAFSKPPEGGQSIDVRIGINLGPVRLVRDINGQPNIIGDGINVAERVMSFGDTGQVLVSRSYFEVVTRISEDYAQLFAYQGSRTDKHVREHEIYAVASPGTEALDVATRRHRARPSARPALMLVETSQTDGAAEPRTRHTKLNLPYAVAALSCLALVCAFVYFMVDHAATHPSDSVKVSPAIRLAQPQPASATGAAPEAATTSSGAANNDAASAAQPSPSPARAEKTHVPKKPVARKETSAVEASTQVALKTTTPAPSAPSHAVQEEHKQAAVDSASSGADAAAASPYTAAAHKAGSALVMLAVSPWGEVIVDGKTAGVSPPLAELELAPGTHQVEIRNGGFVPHLETLQLEANQTIKIKHKFSQR